MLQEERFEFILRELACRHAVKVKDLAEEMSTSQSTIRRDIAELDEKAKLKKVFGGAVSVDKPYQAEEFDMKTRMAKNIEAKQRIAEYAASLLNEHDFVYIDAGTTTACLVESIDQRLAPSLQIVTNSLGNAARLVERGFRVYMPGGSIKQVTEALVGVSAVEYLNQCNFSKCFIGSNGIDTKRGFTTPDMEEAKVKSAAILNSYIAYVLADRSKFDNITSVTFSKLKDACIVTDRLSDKSYEQYTIIKEVQ